MARRVFIRVVGFTDVERHALNTVFRLSQERDTRYWLWEPHAPAAAELALVDGSDPSALSEAQDAQAQGMKLIWVGQEAPASTWRLFHRPIPWPEVVQAMDQLFADVALDFEFLGDDDGPAAADTGPDTQPSQLDEPVPRALIASADRERRLYLRAKLALHRLTQADEAEDAAQALEQVRSRDYRLAMLDFTLPGANGWELVKQLGAERPRLAHVILMKRSPTLGDWVRARLARIDAVVGDPPDSVKLARLLQKL